MAGTPIIKAVADPPHVAFGIPPISAGGVLLFALTAPFINPGYGLVMAGLVHLVSMAVRKKNKHAATLMFNTLGRNVTTNVWERSGNFYSG